MLDIQLFLHDNGNSKYLGIRGADKNLIERHFNSFYNWRATDIPEISWLNDTISPFFAYFQIKNLDCLKKALFEKSLVLLMQKYGERLDGLQGSLESKAKKIAAEEFNNIVFERFLFRRDKPLVKIYGLQPTKIEADINQTQEEIFDDIVDKAV